MVNNPGLPPTSAGRSQTASTASVSLTNLRPGQRLHATVLGTEGQTLSLAVGSKKVNVPLQGAPKLAPGDRLVLEGGQDRATLQVKELIRKDNQALNRSALDALWRGAAGRDQSLRPLSQRLQQALGLPQRPGSSPSPALQALSQGLAALSLKALNGETLKAALEESGLFFEARLQRGLDTSSDRRGQLLRAQGQLQAQNQGSASAPGAGSPGRPGMAGGLPPEPLARSQSSTVQASAAKRLGGALQQVQGQTPSRAELRRRGAEGAGKGGEGEGSRGSSTGTPGASAEGALLKALEQQVDQGLARVRLFQHHTLSQGPDQPSWLLELPIATGEGEDLWRLQFEAQGRRAGEDPEGRRWMARVAVAPSAKDRIEGQITLQGTHLTGHLWCEASATESRLSDALGGLRGHLASKGFIVDQFAIHRGRAPKHLQVPEPGAPS